MKKTIIVLCILVMGACLVGCGSKSKNSDNKDAHFYKTERLNIDYKSEDMDGDFTVSGDNIYYTTMKTYEETGQSKGDGEEAGQSLIRIDSFLWKYNLETNESLCISKVSSYNQKFRSVGLDAAGKLLVLIEPLDYNSFDESIEKGGYYIAKYTDEGEEISKDDITDQIKIDDPDNCFVRKVIFNKDGSIVIMYGLTSICMLDKNYKLAGCAKAPDYIYSIAYSTDGKLYISCMSDSENCNVYEVNLKTQSCGMPLEGFLEGIVFVRDGYGDNNLFVQTRKKLSEYSAVNKSCSPILEWNDNGIIGSSICSMRCLDKDRMLFLCNDTSNPGSGDFMMVTKSVEDPAESKKTITIAACNLSNDTMKQVINYNNTSENYIIKINDYSEKTDPAGAMTIDIISGNVPDIVNMDDINADHFFENHMLEDLTPYIEKDDTVNTEYFLDGILDATKHDGKQYYLMKSFLINTLAGRKSELSGYENGWTMKDMMQYVKSKPEDSILIGVDSRNSIFGILMEYDINSYIDWNNGKTSFDNEDFTNLLEFCSKYPSMDEMDYDNYDDYSAIKSGKQLFKAEYLSSTQDIQEQRKMFDDDIMYVGYPNSQGYGTYIMPMSAFGITASSKNKEGAWDFIKSLLTTGTNKSMTTGFSSSAVEFEDMIKRDTAIKEYTDEDGELVKPRETYVGMENIKIGPATDDEIDTLRELIKKSSGDHFSNSKILNMISDEVFDYFNEMRSLDNTVKVLQDKMNKYVNENR